jgi:hypothetical protein
MVNAESEGQNKNTLLFLLTQFQKTAKPAALNLQRRSLQALVPLTGDYDDNSI